jgi:hypothetical protein
VSRCLHSHLRTERDRICETSWFVFYRTPDDGKKVQEPSNSTVTSSVTFLHFVTHLIVHQVKMILIVFHIIPRDLFLHNHSNYVLPSSYVNWYRNYLTDTLFDVRFSDALSSSFILLSAIPQGSVHCIFNVFVMICVMLLITLVFLVMTLRPMKLLIYLVFACLCSRILIMYIICFFLANFMTLNFGQIRINFTEQTNMPNYLYTLKTFPVSRNDCIKGLLTSISPSR